jgi:ribosomal protein S18 acetylase RimI-like enzyme
MDIRPARPEDVPGVLPMVGKICALHESWDPAKYGFLPNPEDRYRRWLTARADDPRAVFLVADHDSRIVAFLIGTIEQEIPIYRLKEYGFIHDLWVEDEYRHEGIGRQMVMLAIERFKVAGVTQIRLDTAAPNEPARKLFASCGFRPSTIEMLLEL